MDTNEAWIAKYFDPRGADMPKYGLYRPSTTELAIAVNGVKAASWKSAGQGSAAGNSPRCVATGDTPVKASADGNDSTPVVTEEYVAEILVPVPMTVTGFANFNGSVAAGNLIAILYDSTGAKVANSALAGTTMSGTDSFQRIGFTAAVVLQPGTYYVGLQLNNTSARYNTHPVGNFGASKKTGQTFGTVTALTPPTTFTANLGPMGALY